MIFYNNPFILQATQTAQKNNYASLERLADVRDVYLCEDECCRLVAGIVTTVDDGRPEPLHALEVELEAAEAGGDAPDVGEGDTREVAAPAER